MQEQIKELEENFVSDMVLLLDECVYKECEKCFILNEKEGVVFNKKKDVFTSNLAKLGFEKNTTIIHDIRANELIEEARKTVTSTRDL